jgi:hypothetical protein
MNLKNIYPTTFCACVLQNKQHLKIGYTKAAKLIAQRKNVLTKAYSQTLLK